MSSSDPLVCLSCPENFICKKGSIIETLKVKAKFWRANKTTLHLELFRVYCGEETQIVLS